jgi:hypothetical protein
MQQSASGRAWRGTSARVSRALRLIEQGDADQSGVEKLADRLGITRATCAGSSSTRLAPPRPRWQPPAEVIRPRALADRQVG